MKRVVIFLVFLLVVMTSASAQVDSYSRKDALNWLANMTKGDESVEEVSMALLGLNANGVRIDNPLTVFLQRNIDSPCFPKGSCTIKGTSFALFSLGKLNQNTERIEEWLEGQMNDAEVGKWLIQITSSSQGTCNVKSGSTEINVDLNAEGNLILNGNNIGSWIDIERDLKPIVKSEELRVSCPTLGSNVIISLLRQKGDNEFIIDEEVIGSTANLRVDNSCYGIGGCDIESSFYAAWALDSLDKEVKIVPYLEGNALDNVVYNSILHKITNKKKYALKTAKLQGVSGDFGNNIFFTSIAVDSLKDETVYQGNVTKAVLWLKSKQVRDNPATNGSIGGTKFFTGSALYFALREGGEAVPPGSGGYCGDRIVDTYLGEECDSSVDTIAEGAEKDCVGRCDVQTCQCNEVQCRNKLECNSPKEYCDENTSLCVTNSSIVSCRTNLDCNENEKCDIVIGGYCIPGAVVNGTATKGCTSNSDCVGIDQVCNLETGRCEEKEELGKEIKDSCGDDICSLSEDKTSCPEDCKKEGVSVWVWILVFLAALVILAYIFYAKFVSKPPKTRRAYPSEERNRTGRSPSQEYYKPLERDHRDEALERELDRSIKEAQDLLKRK